MLGVSGNVSHQNHICHPYKSFKTGYLQLPRPRLGFGDGSLYVPLLLNCFILFVDGPNGRAVLSYVDTVRLPILYLVMSFKLIFLFFSCWNQYVL